jgi:hypothetical protein
MFGITGLRSIGRPQLLPTIDDTNSFVPNGSYALFACRSGYTNVGGSLNVTCNSNGRWSSFPVCVLDTELTTVTPTGRLACPFSSSTLTTPHGYASDLNNLILLNANQAASGSFIDIICTPPYTLSGNSRVTCADGAWSTQPTCIGKFEKHIESQIPTVFSLISAGSRKQSTSYTAVTMYRHTFCS